MLLFPLRISDQQSVPCTKAIGTRFRHSLPVVPTPHLGSAIRSLHESNWNKMDTLTVYCSNFTSAISNPFLAQEQLVLDLDTHSLLFPLRISDQQSVPCTRATGTRFRHSQPIVPTPHLRSANPFLAQEQLVLDLDTHTLLFTLRISDQQYVPCTRAIGTRFRHSRPVVHPPHLRSAIHSLHKSNWY